MTFSRRIPSDFTPNRFTACIARLRAAGRALLDLTESNPTKAGIDYPADLLSALADPLALVYTPEPFGLDTARAAVATDLARLGMTVSADAVVLTASTSEAYSLLFKLLCEPGDEVLVPRPSYPLFEHLTRLDAVVSVSYELEYHGRWGLDRGSIEAAASSRTRALLIVSPNNPTGSMTTADDLAWLAEFCGRRQIALISDEVFAEFPWHEGSTPGLLLQQPNVLGFTLGGLSKSIGLPQAKLAWMLLSGPAKVLEDARTRLELACDTYLSVATPVQVALPALLERGAGVRRQIQARLRVNRRAFDARAAGVPACRALHGDGGWSLVVRVPSVMTEEDLVMALAEENGVIVHPGYFFDFPHESFVVVSLLTAPDVFDAGIERLLGRFASHHA